jgi:hypothetical protein
MSKCSLVLAVISLAFSPLSGRADDWKTFTSKEGRFSVRMPGSPQEQTQEVKTPDGKLSVHLLVSALAVDRVVYVSYSDYPPKAVEGKQKEFLDGTVKGNVTSLKGKVLSEKKIEVGQGKLPGRELLMDLPDKKQMYRSRIVLAGNRLFQVVAVGSEEFVKSKAVGEYLDSFKIGD